MQLMQFQRSLTSVLHLMQTYSCSRMVMLSVGVWLPDDDCIVFDIGSDGGAAGDTSLRLIEIVRAFIAFEVDGATEACMHASDVGSAAAAFEIEAGFEEDEAVFDFFMLFKPPRLRFDNANSVSRKVWPPRECPPFAAVILSLREEKNSFIRACIILHVQ